MSLDFFHFAVTISSKVSFMSCLAHLRSRRLPIPPRRTLEQTSRFHWKNSCRAVTQWTEKISVNLVIQLFQLLSQLFQLFQLLSQCDSQGLALRLKLLISLAFHNFHICPMVSAWALCGCWFAFITGLFLLACFYHVLPCFAMFYFWSIGSIIVAPFKPFKLRFASTLGSERQKSSTRETEEGSLARKACIEPKSEEIESTESSSHQPRCCQLRALSCESCGCIACVAA